MKVYPFELPKPKNENLIVQEDFSNSFYNKLHRHEEVQLTYILKGSGKLIVWDAVHSYGPGDIFVLDENCPHVFQEVENGMESHKISLFFNKRTFGADFFGMAQLEQISAFFSLLNEGFKISKQKRSIDRIFKKMLTADKFLRFILFLKLIKKLCRTEKIGLTNYVKPREISNTEGQRMQVVLDYVLNNFMCDITLEKVAELACMTPHAFCRFFKQRTNKTFFSFLIEIRIEHACHLLKRDKDISVAIASAKSGFKSISNFNRKFKKFKGMTPSNYVAEVNDVFSFK